MLYIYAYNIPTADNDAELLTREVRVAMIPTALRRLRDCDFAIRIDRIIIIASDLARFSDSVLLGQPPGHFSTHDRKKKE